MLHTEDQLSHGPDQGVSMWSDFFLLIQCAID